MKMHLIVIALMFLTTSPVFGQGPGDRVRVTVLGDVMTGTVSKKSGEAFVILQGDGNIRSVAFSNIRKLERSLGKRGNAGKGFLIGAGVGVLAGIVAGVVLEETADEVGVDTGGLSATAGFFAAVVWGGGLGLVGLGVGSVVKSEKWEVTRIPSGSGHLRISPMFDVAFFGGKRRTLLGARLRF